MTQKTDFPRIIKRLRLEKGISQKSAAASLNISQALLSHYEKGIRECGLGFIIKCAGFYNVTADYLLGIDILCGGEHKQSDEEVNESVIKKDGIVYDTESILCKNSAAKSIACIFDSVKDKESAYKYFACCIYLLCADKSQYGLIYEKIRGYYEKVREENCDLMNPDGKFADILKNLLHNAKNF